MSDPHSRREREPHRKQVTSRGVDSRRFENFRGAAHERPSSVMQHSATLPGQNIPDANLARE